MSPDASGTGFHLQGNTILIEGGGMDVRKELPFRSILRMANVVAKPQGLAANLAVCHN